MRTVSVLAHLLNPHRDAPGRVTAFRLAFVGADNYLRAWWPSHGRRAHTSCSCGCGGGLASEGERGHDEEGTSSDGRCGTARDFSIVSTRGRRRMGRSCQGRRPCTGHLGDLGRHEHSPRRPSVAAQRSCWRVRRGDHRRSAREGRTRQDCVRSATWRGRRGAYRRAWTLRGLPDLCGDELEDVARVGRWAGQGRCRLSPGGTRAGPSGSRVPTRG